MPHYYVSIEALDHKVFKYAGYVHPLNQDSYRKSFEEFGPTGLPQQCNPEPEPCEVLTFDEYKGDRITADGEPYGKQPYTSKQLIMTKRDGRNPRVVWRLMWSQKSSPKEEKDGLAYALEEGWMIHAFSVSDNHAWENALTMHDEVEDHKVDLENPENWVKSENSI
jgi:hypothetical protein